ncbi:MAG TPA: hypothetical protein VN694_13940 [Caulobacteraceae bacterium]|nr:hypothetical protein [Caulobacteraceae bacterium]
MKTACLALLAATTLLTAPLADAAQYVYPLKGQDLAKQSGDEADCSTLARQQSGFDPSKSAQFEAYAPTGTATDTVATGVSLGAIAGGQQGGAAGALGGVGPGQVGSEVTNMTGAVGPSLGVVDELTGAPSPDVGVLQPNVRRPPQAPGQAEYDHARAACLSDRGYSVR